MEIPKGLRYGRVAKEVIGVGWCAGFEVVDRAEARVGFREKGIESVEDSPFIRSVWSGRILGIIDQRYIFLRLDDLLS